MDRNFDLCLSFEPDAIRQHFDGDPEFAFIEDLSDDDLIAVAEDILTWDSTYDWFHRALVDALESVREEDDA